MSSWSVWSYFFSSSLGYNWLPPDLHGFYKWVFDSLEVLNGFFRQVVVSRRDEGIQRKSSRILVEPHLVDAEFRKAWMPYFCRSGHSDVSPEQFLGFIGHLLPQDNYLDLPPITGRDLQEVARAKKSTAGGRA